METKDQKPICKISNEVSMKYYTTVGPGRLCGGGANIEEANEDTGYFRTCSTGIVEECTTKS
jgi:hypothetical protein